VAVKVEMEEHQGGSTPSSSSSDESSLDESSSGVSSGSEQEDQEHDEEMPEEERSPLRTQRVRPPAEELIECDACGVVGFWWYLAPCATCTRHGVHTYCMVRVAAAHVCARLLFDHHRLLLLPRAALARGSSSSSSKPKPQEGPGSPLGNRAARSHEGLDLTWEGRRHAPQVPGSKDAKRAKKRRYKCTTCRCAARQAAAAEAEREPPLEPTKGAQPAELTFFGAEEEEEEADEEEATPAVEGEHQESVEILFSKDGESVVWANAALEYKKKNKGKNKGAVSNGDVARKRVREANSDETWRSQQQQPVFRNVTHIGLPEQPAGGLQALPGDAAAAAMASAKTASKGKRRAASGLSAMEETLANIEAFPRGDGENGWELFSGIEAVHRAVLTDKEGKGKREFYVERRPGWRPLILSERTDGERHATVR